MGGLEGGAGAGLEEEVEVAPLAGGADDLVEDRLPDALAEEPLRARCS